MNIGWDILTDKVMLSKANIYWVLMNELPGLVLDFLYIIIIIIRGYVDYMDYMGYMDYAGYCEQCLIHCISQQPQRKWYQYYLIT